MTVMGFASLHKKHPLSNVSVAIFSISRSAITSKKNLSRNLSNLFPSFYRHPTFFWEALSRAYGYSQYHKFILRKTLNLSAWQSQLAGINC
jgi:hypothetical protein